RIGPGVTGCAALAELLCLNLRPTAAEPAGSSAGRDAGRVPRMPAVAALARAICLSRDSPSLGALEQPIRRRAVYIRFRLRSRGRTRRGFLDLMTVDGASRARSASSH